MRLARKSHIMCVTFKCIYLQKVRQDSKLLESFSGRDQYGMPQCSLAMHAKICFENVKPGDDKNNGNSMNLFHSSHTLISYFPSGIT